jgi:hypothetical protein
MKRSHHRADRRYLLPPRAVVLAEDETHLNLLPHVRASWTLRGMRPWTSPWLPPGYEQNFWNAA